jgi:hypothetical protein
VKEWTKSPALNAETSQRPNEGRETSMTIEGCEVAKPPPVSLVPLGQFDQSSYRTKPRFRALSTPQGRAPERRGTLTGWNGYGTQRWQPTAIVGRLENERVPAEGVIGDGDHHRQPPPPNLSRRRSRVRVPSLPSRDLQ